MISESRIVEANSICASRQLSDIIDLRPHFVDISVLMHDESLAHSLFHVDPFTSTRSIIRFSHFPKRSMRGIRSSLFTWTTSDLSGFDRPLKIRTQSIIASIARYPKKLLHSARCWPRDDSKPNWKIRASQMLKKNGKNETNEIPTTRNHK